MIAFYLVKRNKFPGRNRSPQIRPYAIQYPGDVLLTLWVFLAEENRHAEEFPGVQIEELANRTKKSAGLEAGSMKCRPHRWNIEDWLPLYGKPVEKCYSEFWCLDCGRVLTVRDTTSNMQSSIAQGIASRLFKGERYSGVE